MLYELDSKMVLQPLANFLLKEGSPAYEFWASRAVPSHFEEGDDRTPHGADADSCWHLPAHERGTPLDVEECDVLTQPPV